MVKKKFKLNKQVKYYFTFVITFVFISTFFSSAVLAKSYTKILNNYDLKAGYLIIAAKKLDKTEDTVKKVKKDERLTKEKINNYFNPQVKKYNKSLSEYQKAKAKIFRVRKKLSTLESNQFNRIENDVTKTLKKAQKAYTVVRNIGYDHGLRSVEQIKY